ncbi:hypothetical protein [Methylocapsa palsarum]|uniref:Uncharacterized protein n=1 Tax=Methylocapsa palsarum TaxID=1612308 RepID=A0A1I3XD50_9HYPH|nr:hypothetical protein [Methylocapsa palsarum]SFK16976.1 hypothetical protein SAMN05444581_10312 [Methylocapsa palsarum]
MTSHIFAIGQCVNLRRIGGFATRPVEVFVIKALLPPLGGGATGLEFQYRIKSEKESYERVAVEHQLEGAAPIEAVRGAAPISPGLKPSTRKPSSRTSSHATDGEGVFAVRS